jgi:tetratricopeptide (TPR) repeat protein
LTAVRDKLAKSFRLNGQRQEAIDVLQKLIKDNPLRFETYELLGELYEEQGEMQRALASYRQTLLLDGSQPINYLRVTDLFLKIKDNAKAVETMKEARDKFPGLPQITYSLALALTQAKEFQEAITTFEEAAGEAKNSQQDMLTAEFYFNYGAASEQAGFMEKAVELLKKAIELDPANAAQAYNYLGYMWVDKNQNLDEAGEMIKRAVEMDPDNAAYLDSLGWWYFKKGETDKALEHLQKAAGIIKPEDAVVYDHLGDAFATLNKVPQALLYWQKAVALEPENKTALQEKIESAKQKITAHPAPGAESPPQQ